MDGTTVAGLNRVQWDLRGDAPENGGGRGGGGGGFGGAPSADPGIYRVTLTVDGDDYETLLTVLEDRWLAGW